MTEHVHEWRIIRKWTGDTLVKCDLCDESMAVSEINRRLNEYETLKAATDVLSAEDALHAEAHLASILVYGLADKMQAYAKARGDGR